MKKFSRIAILLLTAIFAMTAIACDGEKEPGKEPPKPVVSVTDMEISTEPKTEYIVGETFDITGGKLKLTYSDDSEGEIDFTAEGVDISTPDLTTKGVKNVTVEYDGFEDSYQITVVNRTYAVTFDLNGGTTTSQTSFTVEENTPVSRPADPTQEGYRFDGWFTEKTGGEEYEFSTLVTSATTIYAHWTQIHVVTFNLNYTGASAPTTVNVFNGEAVVQSSAPSTMREGYIFDGWHTDATASSAYVFSTLVTTPITLYAHWTEASKPVYHVTFDYNCDGAIKDLVVDVEEGNKVEKPTDPTLTGKTFNGWFTAKTGGTAFDFNASVMSAKTAYAQWTVTSYTVNFKYVADGAEVTHKTKEVKPNAKTTAPAMPVVSGYKFVNVWYADKACTQAFDFGTAITADMDLYIKAYKANKFEAEYTYIDKNKAGYGSSDNFSGLKLIFVDNGTAESSNGHWVSGLYYNGAFMEFVINSEKDVDDAILELRLSAEWADIYIAPQDTSITVPGSEFPEKYYGMKIFSAPAVMEGDKAKKDGDGYVVWDTTKESVVDYQPIAITGAISFEQSMRDKRPFSDYIVTQTFVLKKGVNVIRFVVENSHAPYDGTMNATAPMFDSITVYSDSALSWEPHTENLANPEALNQ